MNRDDYPDFVIDPIALDKQARQMRAQVVRGWMRSLRRRVRGEARPAKGHAAHGQTA